MGRTPRSARVPLDPLLANGVSIIRLGQADEGVGLPTMNADCPIPPDRINLNPAPALVYNLTVAFHILYDLESR